MLMKRTTAIVFAVILFCIAGALAFSSTSVDSIDGDTWDCGSVISRNEVPQRSSPGRESVGHRCASDLDTRALIAVGFAAGGGVLLYLSRREGWVVGT